uniref:Protein orai n=1 Tax=Meloidogyne enterolobii TaxID=390850 RepID=A0A6V7UJY5_MELEN|nr:unnamed protein product [Meloidogyne enterolobii]
MTLIQNDENKVPGHHSLTLQADTIEDWPLPAISIAHPLSMPTIMNDKRKIHPLQATQVSTISDEFGQRRSISSHSDLNKLGHEETSLYGGLKIQTNNINTKTNESPKQQNNINDPVIILDNLNDLKQHSINSRASSQSTAPIYSRHLTLSLQRQQHSSTPTPSFQSPGGGNLPSYATITRLHKLHRGELSINEKYRYDLSRAQLKASSRTSALLSGFAMIALVELQYLPDTPKPLLIMLGVVTTLLVSVHLLALMMSTCLLPYIEANGCTQDSPHIKLRFYIELSWFFSTCVGLLLFLLEIGVIFFVKFNAIGYIFAAYITTGMLVPVLIIFIVISYLIHRNRFTHSIERVSDKVVDLQKYLCEAEAGNIQHAPSTIKNSGIGVNNLRNYKEC